MDDVQHNVPDHTIETLDRYWNHGYSPGSFLGYLLCGDVYNAIIRADHWNKGSLGQIVEYIMHKAPRGSYGSPELFQDWINHGEYFQQYQKQRVVEYLSR